MNLLYKGSFSRLIAFFVALCLVSAVFVSCGGVNGGFHGGTETDSTSDGVGSHDTTERIGVVNRDHTICIDPGHGFGDVGAESEYIGDLTEKDINLKFSLYLRDELAERGYEVFLTHDGHTFPKTDIDNGNNVYDFKERTEYANNLGMDYFISIHCNTYDGYQDVRGVRIYYSEDARVPVKEPEKASEFLCERLMEAFPNYKKPLSYMTPEDNSYYVTHWAESCALLVEIGYLTNKADAENMLRDNWQLKMVDAIADGIDDYFTE